MLGTSSSHARFCLVRSYRTNFTILFSVKNIPDKVVLWRKLWKWVKKREREIFKSWMLVVADELT